MRGDRGRDEMEAVFYLNGCLMMVRTGLVFELIESQEDENLTDTNCICCMCIFETNPPTLSPAHIGCRSLPSYTTNISVKRVPMYKSR